jgi:hypothetical protein
VSAKGYVRTFFFCFPNVGYLRRSTRWQDKLRPEIWGLYEASPFAAYEEIPVM